MIETYRDVTVGGHAYPFNVSTNRLSAIGDCLAQFDTDRFIIVADSSAWFHHGERLIKEIRYIAKADLILVPPGEAAKTFSTLENVCEAALRGGASRRSVVVGFGGGAVGNVAGLSASLLFRGIRFVQIPTTLLAVLDSGISLKQAINSHHGKNLLGTYYAPAAVTTDTSFLETLSDREIRSGIGEVIKNGLALEPESLPWLTDAVRPTESRLAANLRRMITMSVDCKVAIMTEDPYERKRALALEYGHTVGHAVEILDFERRSDSISHGEAVGFGMLVAAHVSRSLGYGDESLVDQHEELLQAAGLTASLPPGIGIDEVISRLNLDGKRGYLILSQFDIAMVLLREPGKVAASTELPLVKVELDEVRTALQRIQAKGGR